MVSHWLFLNDQPSFNAFSMMGNLWSTPILTCERFEIVNGVTEVEGIAEEKTVGAEEDEEKGVPAFWLNSMKNYEVLAEEVSWFYQ
ncbi:hypothetical protein AHAS_Ahas13G0385000 [Arachis hypogaea]